MLEGSKSTKYGSHMPVIGTFSWYFSDAKDISQIEEKKMELKGDFYLK
jgi:hypothetical protein